VHAKIILKFPFFLNLSKIYYEEFFLFPLFPLLCVIKKIIEKIGFRLSCSDRCNSWEKVGQVCGNAKEQHRLNL